MSTIVCIVEGHGEVEAVPILLRRISASLDRPIDPYPRVLPPLRIPANKLEKQGELERAVELAARKSGVGGAILILLDCDDGCPAEVGPRFLRRARAARSDRSISVVFAKREYEAWFLASAESLRGKRGLREDIVSPSMPETVRDAKGWLSERMAAGSTYSETTDQPALTECFDMKMARAASDSFDKCYRDLSRLLGGLFLVSS